jgi:hypothetical protein
MQPRDIESDRLLLACLAPSTPGTLAEALAALPPEKLEALGTRAASHRIGTLVQRHVAALPDPPPAAAEALNGIRAKVAETNGTLFRNLAAMMDAFASAGLRLAVLKGAALAGPIYGDVTLRSMRDIDVLVPKDQLAPAEQLLLEIGYTQENPAPIDLCCAVNLHIAPFTRDDGTDVDVHWTIEQPTSPFPIDPAQLWEHVRSAELAGRTATILGDAHQLLHLCLHMSYHHGFEVTLQPVCDIAWLVAARGEVLDWEEVAGWAEAWEVGRLVGMCLAVANDLLQAGVPARVLVRLLPGELDRKMVAVVGRHVLSHPRLHPDETASTRRMILQWMRQLTGRPRRDTPVAV